MYTIVIIAAQLDRIANANSFFRTSTTLFFVADEGLSILQNVDELGVKLPGFLITHLKKPRDKHDKMDGDKLPDAEAPPATEEPIEADLPPENRTDEQADQDNA